MEGSTMNETQRLPLGLGIFVGAVIAGSATLLPWRAGLGVDSLGGQVSLVIAVTLGIVAAYAIRDPSVRGTWLAGFGLAVLGGIVAVGYLTTDAGLVPAPCDDIASCAYKVMVPAGVGLGLVAVIAGCVLAGTTALVGARRRQHRDA
jgi:hypothetical protein